jgi:hypothetical protein
VITGLFWQENNGKVWKLSDCSTPYFYVGGWATTMGGDRSTEPNRLAISVHQALATRVSCDRVSFEFWLMQSRPEQTRLLLPFVFDDAALFDDVGDLDPDVAQSVRDNISYLMAHLWDQEVDADDPDLNELFDHFVETVRDGSRRIEAGVESASLYTYCMGDYDFDNRQAIPYGSSVRQDPNYIIRAWKSLIYVFLTDHLFVLEGGE